MTTYDLYLDHGPKRKKTMVHVIGLMGCVHNGPTTDQVLDETPEAIRGFLSFLAEHGDSADPEAPFDVRIAEEITEGQWLGQGIVVFGPDHDPVKPAELNRLVARHGWIRDATLELVDGLSPRELAAKPAHGRPVGEILLHVMGSDCAYLSSGLASNRTMNRLNRDAEKGELDVREALAEGAELFAADLLAATPAQRSAVIPRGQMIGSVRRTFRRALEHGWEHFQEIRARLGG
jgi:predicted RNase H-like HicB family nuclease